MSRIGYGKDIVRDGLVLHLDAANPQSYDGNSTTWRDLSGNGNHGTLVNGPTYNSSNKGSVVFDGVNDYIQGNTVLEPKDYITISAWYKATGAPSGFNDSAGGVIICSSPDYIHGYWLSHSWLNQTAQFSTYINNGMTSSTNTALNNVINNVVGVWDGSKQYIYINGVLSTSRNYTTPIYYSTTGDRNFRIGKWGYSIYQRQFNGLIYNISMYSIALTSNQILQNYNATKSRYGL
jgi:hypothetical protein